MTRVRSILWVGRGDELGCASVADAPLVDIVWARDLEDALGHPLAHFDALVLDVDEPGAALAAVRRLGRMVGSPPLLVRLAPAAAAQVPALLAGGAGDVVLRDPDPDGPGRLELLERLEKLTAPARRSAASEPGSLPEGVVASSAALREVFALVARAARSQATVLLTGETGTGKEVLARAVHRGSTRAEGPFIGVNCAAFPEALLESELFGHVRGAFTGADREKRGLFEVAGGGTLFLDEVGEMPAALQAKLLRVLQEREVRPVGGTRARPTNARVIAATNRDLRGEAERGAFREDLYYRLAVFPIAVPSLRARPEDVLPLARHFLAHHGEREGRPGLRLAPDAGHLLQAYAWPGNVRELENEMQRAVALAEPGDAITPARLSERILGIAEGVAAAGEGETLRATLDRVEAWLLRRALDDHQGRRAATARTLGLTREGLYKKLKRLGIE